MVRHLRLMLFLGITLALVIATFVFQSTRPLLATTPSTTTNSTASATPAKFSNAQLEFFEKKIRPILVAHCQDCHGPDDINAGLRVDNRAFLLKGGDTGPAIVPGKPDKSLFLKAVQYHDTDLQMPPDGKLSKEKIALLTQWIKDGAAWPNEKAILTPDQKKKFDLWARFQTHWSWRPITQPKIPEAQQSQWPANAIDRFILHRLEKNKLHPAPQASRRRLIRRLYIDVIGLPPTNDQVEKFVNDQRPDAYPRVVDQLLSNPAFGERWGRHWLDLVRYAETRGHEFDGLAANAFQYRDYVIRALNVGVPYDQFTLEHLAGDLVEKPRRHPTQGYNESVLGTGFFYLNEWVQSPVDIRQDEADRMDNQIDVMTKTFLGLTVACARCHDHKFDAISTKDYYSLAGFLQSSNYRQVRFETDLHNKKVAHDYQKAQQDFTQPLIQQEIERLNPTVQKLETLLATAHAFWLKHRDPLQKAAQSKTGLQLGNLPKPLQIELKEIAKTSGIHHQLVIHWLQQFERAQTDVSNPLFDLAQIQSTDFPKEKQRLTNNLANRKQDYQAFVEKSQAVVDYTKPDPRHWHVNGPAFGNSPQPAGSLLFGKSADRPILGLLPQPAAVRDPFWTNLAVPSSHQKETGQLARYIRAGQTLRTPTFLIDKPFLVYEVVGTGWAHAVVDSHRMIKGPLHGQLVRRLNPGKNQESDPSAPTLYVHNIAPYQGHRTHVEFAPADDQPFAITRVWQTDLEPKKIRPDIFYHDRSSFEKTFNPSDSLEKIYPAYQKVAQQALHAWKKQQPKSTAQIRWINFLLRNPNLRVSTESEMSMGPKWSATYQQLQRQVQWSSACAPAIMDGSGEDEYVFIRGRWKNAGPLAPRGMLTALRPKEKSDALSHGSGRLKLAQKIISNSNPYFARVMANRLWHHLMGRGIVSSVDNFGVLGQDPTHPELLDHLAVKFRHDQFSIKKLIRYIVLSKTYQQSSRPTADDINDPQNKYWHRMNLRRLEAEALRDGILQVTGQLNRQMYGESVEVYLTDFMQGRGRPGKSGPLDGDGRRSIYGKVRRNFLPPMLAAFDFPVPATTVGRRSVSNVPAQALILMNDPFVRQQTERWCQHLCHKLDRPQDRIDTMIRAVYSRPAQPQEIGQALAFLKKQHAHQRDHSKPWQSHPKTWANLAHVLFNTKEFQFR